MIQHPVAVSVGAEVRGQLAKRRITGVAAARAIGLSQPAFSRRVNGEIPFDVTELTALGQLLGVPAETFLKDAA